MRLQYCYILFLDEKGVEKPYRGLHHVELNLSSSDRFTYDFRENTLIRKNRNNPIPAHFWSSEDTAQEYRNIYNVNVIAGENGSGKTTVIRCLMNLLDFFHDPADPAQYHSNRKISTEIVSSRVLLILEEDSISYLLDYVPNNLPNDALNKWKTNKPLQVMGFPKNVLRVFPCHHWKELTEQRQGTGNRIVSFLLKTKIIYITNTLTQYDYERHIGERNERLRDFFIYDASIGSTIGPEIAQFFPYEVYKQVKYIFDKNQKAIRDTLKLDQVLRMPHALRFRLRTDEYQKYLFRAYFPSIFVDTLSNENRELGGPNDEFEIHPEYLDFLPLLRILCAAAFAKNLGNLANLDLSSLIGRTPVTDFGGVFSSQKEPEEVVKRIENKFYHLIGSIPLKGHTGAISCVAVLPDGRVVSGSSDKTLRLWDSVTGKCMQIWEGHNGRVTCVAALADRRVVSGSEDQTLRVWDTATGQCLQTLVGHEYEVAFVSGFPDGRVVSGSIDSTVRVWDASTGQCLQILSGHKYGITSMIVLPDGRVVSGGGGFSSSESLLRVWDVTTGQCLQTLVGHSESVRCMTVLPDGHVVSGSDDNTLRVWDATTGQCLQTLVGHSKCVRCVAVLPDGHVVSGAEDNTLRVWDVTTGECLKILSDHTGEVDYLAIIPDGRMVSGSEDNSLRVWDAITGQCLEILEGHKSGIICLGILPDGRVVSGASDQTIRIWTLIEQMRSLAPAAHNLMNCCLEYLNYLDEKQNTLFSRFSRIDKNTFELSLDAIKEVKANKAGGKEENETYRDLITFMQKYRYTCEPSFTIDFDWGLSSGEENMLRIFSNLYHVFDRDYSSGNYGNYKIYNNEAHVEDYNGKTECDTVLLFMDEVDLTLHPEWQRRLVEILTAYIPQIYPTSCAKDIQLILSTHSPLILGDIPGENITYLFAKDTQSQDSESYRAVPSETFGQNIHTILKENFFLSKGTVGAFAARKINEVAKELASMKGRVLNEQDQEKLSELRQTIRLVAPGILRTQLEYLIRDLEDDEDTRRQEETNHLLEKWQTLSGEKRQKLLNILEQEGKADD